MNDSLGFDPAPPVRTTDRPANSTPLDWKGALSGLISSRIAIIQSESQEVSKTGIKKVIAYAAAAFCVIFAWALLLAGGIGAISAGLKIDWYWIALIVCFIHLIVALILVSKAKSPGAEFFPVTRSEFKKDREWLENFQKPK